MWKDSIRNIVVIFQPNILRIVRFYVRHSALVFFDQILSAQFLSKISKLFLEVKIVVNQVNLTPYQAPRWRQRWKFFLFSELMPIRVEKSSPHDFLINTLAAGWAACLRQRLCDVRWCNALKQQALCFSFRFGQPTTYIHKDDDRTRIMHVAPRTI